MAALFSNTSLSQVHGAVDAKTPHTGTTVQTIRRLSELFSPLCNAEQLRISPFLLTRIVLHDLNQACKGLEGDTTEAEVFQ